MIGLHNDLVKLSLTKEDFQRGCVVTQIPSVQIFFTNVSDAVTKFVSKAKEEKGTTPVADVEEIFQSAKDFATNSFEKSSQLLGCEVVYRAFIYEGIAHHFRAIYRERNSHDSLQTLSAALVAGGLAAIPATGPGGIAVASVGGGLLLLLSIILSRHGSSTLRAMGFHRHGKQMWYERHVRVSAYKRWPKEFGIAPRGFRYGRRRRVKDKGVKEN